MNISTTGNSLISVQPDELSFQFELEKQSFCDLRVVNNTENNVAFKVKTTSPRKYFVRPNIGIVKSGESCVIRVTLLAQREYPPDMQCKDKFLLQSTVVPANSDAEEILPDTFNKDSGKHIEDCKLRVLYILPTSVQANLEDETFKATSSRSLDDSPDQVSRLKEERDATVRQTQQLQQELDMLRRKKYQKGDQGFSFTFAIFVGLIGIIIGFLLSLLSSSPPPEIN